MSFQDLLKKDNSVCIHHKNLQFLLIEMYKAYNGLSPKIFSELFQKRGELNYNFRSNNLFVVPKAKSVFNGEETVSVLGPKIWNSLPDEIKEKRSLLSFKTAIKKLDLNFCPCRLCKKYISGVGFI